MQASLRILEPYFTKEEPQLMQLLFTYFRMMKLLSAIAAMDYKIKIFMKQGKMMAI